MLKLRKKKIVVLGMAFVDENKNLRNYLRDLTISRDVQEKIEVIQSQELLEFLKHGVVLAPGVIVDGKLKSAGRQPTKAEMEEWIKALKSEIKKAEESMDNLEDYVEETEIPTV